MGLFAGTSGGCQPAFFLTAGIPMDAAWNEWFLPMVAAGKQDHKHRWYVPWYWYGLPTIMKRSKEFLELLFKRRGREGYKDRLFLSLTKLNVWQKPRNICFTACGFTDFDDCFKAIETTQWIPFVFGLPVTRYRDHLCVDGFMGLIASHNRGFYEPKP